MKIVERQFYIAKGESLRIVQEHEASVEAAHQALIKFMDELGCQRISFGGGMRTHAEFRFDEGKEPLVPGLRESRAERNLWHFDKKCPEGKALALRFGTLRIPHNSDLTDKLKTGLTYADMQVHYVSAEKVAGAWVLSVPYLSDKGCVCPADAEPIKTSTYWALKEAADGVAPVVRESPFADQREFEAAFHGHFLGKPEEGYALYRKLIDEELAELDAATTAEEHLDAIIDLIYVVIGAGNALGHDLASAWAEVHRTNMAKLGPDGKPIVRESDGKILKPEGWVPPKLAPFVGHVLERFKTAPDLPPVKAV